MQNRSEILSDNNRLSNQLLLSSEIPLFEVGLTKNPQNPSKSIEIYVQFTMVRPRILQGNMGELRIFGDTNFKWTYLRAQGELVGQTVAVTEYFGSVLHAEPVFRAIEHLWICFRDLVSFSFFNNINDPSGEIL